MARNRRMSNKVRNAYIVSTTSITLVLFLLGTVGYIMLNIWSGAQKLQESFSLNIMLNTDVSDEQKAVIVADLDSTGMIKQRTFISKDQAAKELKDYLDGDFIEFLDHNPLPDSYEIRLLSEFSDKENIAALVKQINSWKGVNEVIYQRGVIEQISDNMGKFTIVLLLFGATLLVISLILLNNTIKVTIFSRRYIINTMKLVGATRGFIIRPFVSKATKQGILAGIFASIMFIGLIAGINDRLPEVSLISDKMILIIIGAMIAGGAIISLLFTFFAVAKFVNMNTRQMHSL